MKGSPGCGTKLKMQYCSMRDHSQLTMISTRIHQGALQLKC